jgi:transposase
VFAISVFSFIFSPSWKFLFFLKRAIGLFELHRGKTYTSVSKTLNITLETLSAWVAKYRQRGLEEALCDQNRPGRPIEIDGNPTALACSKAPEGYEKWSLRLLAEKVVELKHISHTEVATILKKRSKTTSQTHLGY